MDAGVQRGKRRQQQPCALVHEGIPTRCTVGVDSSICHPDAPWPQLHPNYAQLNHNLEVGEGFPGLSAIRKAPKCTVLPRRAGVMQELELYGCTYLLASEQQLSVWIPLIQNSYSETALVRSTEKPSANIREGREMGQSGKLVAVLKSCPNGCHRVLGLS